MDHIKSGSHTRRFGSPAAQRWALLIACVVLLGLLQLAMPETGAWLRYQRSQVYDGEIWRLFAAHLVHLGWRHWALNSAGLALVFALYWRWLSWGRFLIWVGASMLGVGVGLWVFSPQVLWYVGLSGVLHGLLVAGAVFELHAGRRDGALILVLVALKLGWEQIQGALPGAELATGGPVVVDAHLYGALAGLAAALAQCYFPARLVRRTSG